MATDKHFLQVDPSPVLDGRFYTEKDGKETIQKNSTIKTDQLEFMQFSIFNQCLTAK